MLNQNYSIAQWAIFWKVPTLFLAICLLTLTTQDAIGQDGNVSSITLNATTADQIVSSLERIIEQNDGSSLSSLFSSYIGMMAFLVGIALVIFGFQLSRAEKATLVARRAYKILILALLVPVVVLFLYAVSPFSEAGREHSAYLGVASLLMIPTGAVLAIMASRFHEKL